VLQGVRERENVKSQAPTSREASNFNDQAELHTGSLEFDGLELLWSLDVGGWFFNSERCPPTKTTLQGARCGERLDRWQQDLLR
jgi:hypothetical protein